MSQDTLDVFVYEELCERCLGNVALVDRVLAAFQVSFGSDIEALENQLAASRWDPAERIVHRMKGATGNASAPQLYRLAVELQRSLPEHRIETLNEQMADLWSAWGRFVDRVRQNKNVN